MSLHTSIRHNPTSYTTLILSLAILFGFITCQLTPTQRKTVLKTSSKIATAATKAAPPPYKEIALIIASLLGGGTLVDNRRKDLLIKTLQKSNDLKDKTMESAVKTNNANPARRK